MITEQDIEIAYEIMMAERRGNKEIFDAMKGNTIAKILVMLHSHAEIENDINPDAKVYREEDVVALLIALGAPAPEWPGR